MYISNESSVPFCAVQDGIACTPPRLSEVVPNVSNVGLTAWRWPSLILLPSFKCCLMSSEIGWHIRDKLRPMPKHGSVLLLRPRKPEGSLRRKCQDCHSTLTQLLISGRGGGRGRLYTYRYTVTTKMTPALCVRLIVRDKVTKQETTTSEQRGGPKRKRTEVLLFTSLNH